MKILISIITFSFLFLAGCSSNKDEIGSEYRLNNKWVLQSLNGRQATYAEFAQGFPEMELKVDAMVVYGNTGCNSMSGSMAATTRTIEFSNIVTTFMHCDGVNETGFLNALEKADRWKIENNRLYLYAGNNIVAVFRKK
jgi:heat shock protein HslJ